nr:spermidine/putrescine ABC transporter substrate-binding protein [Actinomycetota bacterium]
MNDDPMPDPLMPDPALLRGLTQSRIGRRDVLGLLGAAGGASLLSACGGIASQGKKADTSKSAVQRYWARQKPTNKLVWANWPLYLDTQGKSGHPTLAQFERQTGINVKYVETIQD